MAEVATPTVERRKAGRPRKYNPAPGDVLTPKMKKAIQDREYARKKYLEDPEAYNSNVMANYHARMAKAKEAAEAAKLRKVKDDAMVRNLLAMLQEMTSPQ